MTLVVKEYRAVMKRVLTVEPNRQCADPGSTLQQFTNLCGAVGQVI